MTTTHMTRDDVIRIVRAARQRGARPDLSGRDLSRLDLSGFDLSGLDLSWSNMSGAALPDSSLCDSDLSGADLSGTDLNGSDLYGSDLYRANFYGADLRHTNLRRANMGGARGIFSLGEVPSGPAYMVPLPNGTWHLDVGCWDGTTAELRNLIAGDDWPEAVGAEQGRRRPILTRLADHADFLAAYHDDWLTAVVERWGDKETTP